MSYQFLVRNSLGQVVGVVRDDGATVGADPNSAAWQAFLLWNASQPVPWDLTAVVRPRVPRTIQAILVDVKALTGAQQLAVWSDITSGSPPKWQGSNDPVVWCKGSQPSTLTAQEKQVGAAFYVRENPTYLVHPAFDVTINVPGDA